MNQQSNEVSPATLFYSYAHEDDVLHNELEKHLSLLRRQGMISTWHNRLIAPGTDWSQEIDAHLNSSSIILLLISPNFLASDYCYGVEMQRALERQKNGEAYVIPVLLRPVDLHEAPFAHLQCLPRDGRAVTSWSNLDEAFYDVTRSIRLVAEHLHKVDRTLPLLPLPSWTANNRASSQSRTNRERMLKRVRAFWIKGVLEQSLHHAALITLGLYEQPDAIASPWRFVMQEAERPARSLPAGTSITEVYNDADGELLILGEPGAGKTTLLLSLARDLLDCADQDPTHPIPVVFNLSSWTEEQQSLVAWLVEELNIKYQVPRKVGQAWIDANELLLLLDGLDEVAELQRSSCIKAINAYRHEHTIAVVVCSRSAEYQAQAARIALQLAVLVQPLSAQQIDDYLSIAGGRLQSVREALYTDPELQEMIRTPLMLSIVALAYRRGPIRDFQAEGAPETLQQQALATYVQRMLQRQRSKTTYTKKQTLHWLSWLARQLKQRNQTEFYLEHLQIDWLSQHPIYRFLLTMSTGLLIACFGWIAYGLFYLPYFGLAGSLTLTTLTSLFFIAIYVLVNSFLLPLLEMQKRRMQTTKGKMRSWEQISSSLMNILSTRFSYGFLIGLPVGSLVGLIMGLTRGMIAGLTYGLVDVLILTLEFAAFDKFSAEVKPVEVVVWSWTRVWRNLGKSTLSGVCFALVMGIRFLNELGLAYAIPCGILFGIGYFVTSNLIFWGLSHEILDKRNISLPNQGIRRSAKNCLFFGAVTSLSCVFFFGVAYGLFGGLTNGLYQGIIIGFVFGGVAALWGGGFACFQHIVVRILLWSTGHMPWNYSRFLEDATKHILLRKVGGGYIFVHRLLLDYFASLHQSSPPES